MIAFPYLFMCVQVLTFNPVTCPILENKVAACSSWAFLSNSSNYNIPYPAMTIILPHALWDSGGLNRLTSRPPPPKLLHNKAVLWWIQSSAVLRKLVLFLQLRNRPNLRVKKPKFQIGKSTSAITKSIFLIKVKQTVFKKFINTSSIANNLKICYLLIMITFLDNYWIQYKRK